MNKGSETTSDLVWNLDNITDKETAAGFLRQFESTLCVFSNTVQQLYANYSISKVNKVQGNLVVLPNPYAAHDTFQSIKDKAVVGTGLFIVPAKAIGKEKGLHLMQRSRKTGKYNSLPLVEGLKRMRTFMPDDNPFLPVITNRDLRELPNRAPILHLHRLDSKKLEHLSSFQLKDVSSTITGKVDAYLEAA